LHTFPLFSFFSKIILEVGKLLHEHNVFLLHFHHHHHSSLLPAPPPAPLLGHEHGHGGPRVSGQNATAAQKTGRPSMLPRQVPVLASSGIVHRHTQEKTKMPMTTLKNNPVNLNVTSSELFISVPYYIKRTPKLSHLIQKYLPPLVLRRSKLNG
jgi:hypothetical protein